MFYHVPEEPSDEAKPHASRRPDGRRAHGHHKTQQLCRQVERALSLALAGECGDPVLRDLLVLAVTPAPNAGRLLVDVSPGGAASEEPTHEILARLDRAGGLLRRAVAAAIVRKRVPELLFRVLAAAAGGGG